MNLIEYFPAWVSFIVIVVTLMFFSKLCEDMQTKGKLVIALVLGSAWWFGFDLTMSKDSLKGYTTTKTLVSTSPSESYLEGSFSIFMGTGSGEVETKRWYLLREEIRDGLYKDFTVKNDVFIEERNNLPKGKGLFEQKFTCSQNTVKYRMIVWEIVDSKRVCRYSNQTIAVPKGFVIKDLNI